MRAAGPLLFVHHAHTLLWPWGKGQQQAVQEEPTWKEKVLPSELSSHAKSTALSLQRNGPNNSLQITPSWPVTHAVLAAQSAPHTTGLSQPAEAQHTLLLCTTAAKHINVQSTNFLLKKPFVFSNHCNVNRSSKLLLKWFCAALRANSCSSKACFSACREHPSNFTGVRSHLTGEVQALSYHKDLHGITGTHTGFFLLLPTKQGAKHQDLHKPGYIHISTESGIALKLTGQLQIEL